MEKEKKKRKLTLDDIKEEIRDYIIHNYSELKANVDAIPDSIHKVLITFQPGSSFIGVGDYTIDIDTYGIIKEENFVKENEHYGTLCTVHISSDKDGCPKVEIKEKLYFNKRY